MVCKLKLNQMNEQRILERGEIIKSNASCNFERKIIQQSVEELINEQNMPWRWSKNPIDQSGELFKQIKDHPDYEVSNYGRIRRNLEGKKSKILKPSNHAENYRYYIRINQVSFRVADLMYETFIGDLGEMIADCKDGNRRNLIIDNLQMVAPSRKPRSKVKKYKRSKKQKSNKVVSIQFVKHKEVSVPYTLDTKEQALKDLNMYLSNGYYVAVSETGEKEGYYFLRLKPVK
ncbi:hypothetical protein AB832_07860 [Flavobacteriaceae bacterium (ex Bugula neritina AB1)]|nr:hypothetical protein AB832_07860 [Flavobacteriaceae bacterium (ex Bugula neritina AB1)]